MLVVRWIGNLGHEDDAVAGLVGAELLDGFIEVGHFEEFDLGGDLVVGGEVEHFVHEGAVCGRAAGDGALGGEEEGDVDGEGVRRSSEEAEGAGGF